MALLGGGGCDGRSRGTGSLEVSGQLVRAITREAISGVTVSVSGSSDSVVTDANGNFTIATDFGGGDVVLELLGAGINTTTTLSDIPTLATSVFVELEFDERDGSVVQVTPDAPKRENPEPNVPQPEEPPATDIAAPPPPTETPDLPAPPTPEADEPASNPAPPPPEEEPERPISEPPSPPPSPPAQDPLPEPPPEEPPPATPPPPNPTVLIGDGSFENQSSFSEENVSLVVTGDFTGDSLNDLLVVVPQIQTEPSIIKVFQGDAQGNFVEIGTFESGRRLVAFSTADFNADGKLDVAIFADDTARVDFHVHLGNGDGSFSEPLSFIHGFRPHFLDASDINGDGHIDIVSAAHDVVTENGSTSFQLEIRVNLGDGSGNFDTSTEPFLFPSGSVSRPLALKTGDLNSDGFIDVVVKMPSSIHLLLSDAAGGLVEHSNLPSSGLINLLVEDINGDQNVDILDGNFLYLGNGEANFSEPTTLQIGNSWTHVVDLNSDGFPDLVGANSSESGITVLFGDSSGTFESFQTSEYSTAFTGSLLADFNADTIPDLLVWSYLAGTNNITLLRAGSVLVQQ